MVESLTYLGCKFTAESFEKNFENWPTFDRVKGKIIVLPFFEMRYNYEFILVDADYNVIV